MKQQKGFTLIELIIVIVILGILAVTAAPRFFDFGGDAREATLGGVQAALKGGAEVVYARASIAGVQNDAGDATYTSAPKVDDLALVFGYPDARHIEETGSGVNTWATLDSEFTVVPGEGAAAEASPAAGSFGINGSGGTVDYSITDATGNSCHVLYTNSTGVAVAPVITVVSGGC